MKGGTIMSIKPIRIIDYMHRGRIKTYVVNVPICQGYIRLDYSDYNVNRMSGGEWVKFKEENLIKEYSPNDETYKRIISIRWRFARLYIARIKDVGICNIGTHILRDIYKQAVKEETK